ncbi:hypothetical protein DV707_17295 (plasmid) [Halobellus limi]|uniref:Uncharacterized protein n=1 Tax=Halobellus limi TaxID=699433 RepID=A0A1H6BTQ7_9EURY|nr:hypothetical protein DV707_17295 [Halobellus limi]SEG64094.1 hypothetical protein SAMN04488133_3020 [Halobellus limi]
MFQEPTSAVSELVLQAGTQLSESLRMGLLAYELIGAALGVFIAFLAYRGYRRNKSRPMLFVAVGFALALGVPLILTVVYLVLPITGGRVVLQATSQTFEVAGLLCIIYGLRL